MHHHIREYYPNSLYERNITCCLNKNYKMDKMIAFIYVVNRILYDLGYSTISFIIHDFCSIELYVLANVLEIFKQSDLVIK